jgi:hypothetical protein
MMRIFIICTLACAISFGQSPRDAYRVPYKNWRQNLASLEKDAATPSANFGGRVASASKGAQEFLNARISFLSESEGLMEMPWASRTVSHPDKLLVARPDVHRFLNGTDGILAKAITSFGGVKDPAIQEVRQAMERERAALNVLLESLNKREALVGDLTKAIEESERLRSAVAKSVADANAVRGELVKSIRVEGVAWSRYYADLVEGAGSPPANK